MIFLHFKDTKQKYNNKSKGKKCEEKKINWIPELILDTSSLTKIKQCEKKINKSIHFASKTKSKTSLYFNYPIVFGASECNRRSNNPTIYNIIFEWLKIIRTLRFRCHSSFYSFIRFAFGHFVLSVIFATAWHEFGVWFFFSVWCSRDFVYIVCRLSVKGEKKEIDIVVNLANWTVDFA